MKKQIFLPSTTCISIFPFVKLNIYVDFVYVQAPVHSIYTA